MDFYKEKRLALDFIEELQAKGYSKTLIFYRVQKRHGFSRKFVEDHLKMLEQLAKEPKLKPDPKKQKEAEKEFKALAGDIGISDSLAE